MTDETEKHHCDIQGKAIVHRILIIDDDRSVRDSLKQVLQDTGYAVSAAADGQEGLSALNQQQFQLLILDLDLPKVSGWDILDVAAEQHPSLPVVILTGLADQCEPGALAEADALLEKPTDADVLLNLVETLLNEPTEKRLRAKARPGARLAQEQQ